MSPVRSAHSEAVSGDMALNVHICVMHSLQHDQPPQRTAVDPQGDAQHGHGDDNHDQHQTATLHLSSHQGAVGFVWSYLLTRQPKQQELVLDMDSSVSPTHGNQEGSSYNGHFECTCYLSPPVLLQPRWRCGACTLGQPHRGVQREPIFASATHLRFGAHFTAGPGNQLANGYKRASDVFRQSAPQV